MNAHNQPNSPFVHPSSRRGNQQPNYNIYEQLANGPVKVRTDGPNRQKNNTLKSVVFSCLFLTIGFSIFLFVVHYFELSDQRSTTEQPIAAKPTTSSTTSTTEKPVTTTSSTSSSKRHDPQRKAREIKVYNKCLFTTWVGILGPGNPSNGGFRLNSGETKSVYVNDLWSGRIWPRTHCDGNMNCATGSCGNSVECNGAGGVPPVSLAQFSLSGLDYYDVSLVDGYNIPVLIDAYEGNGDCKRAGGCVKDVNELCPSELAVKKDGRTVACRSRCNAYNNDRDCCRGEFEAQGKCRQSQTAKMFKDACPGASSHAHDSSVFTCKGATYVVQFC